MSKRFTIDGSGALELQLERICDRVLREVQAHVPPPKLEALVLGGSYGRGEGGVLKTRGGDEPYNDLEFYVFVRGCSWRQTERLGGELTVLGEHLAHACGLAIDFKVDSLEKLRRSPISMFSYDLVSGHRILLGGSDVFRGCEHHRDARRIPLCEATRLLFNRCGGLLLVREILARRAPSTADMDFIGRNLAKAEVALGDAILTAHGLYDWSVVVRRERFQEVAIPEPLAWMPRVQRHYAAGAEFKLHPRREEKSAVEFTRDHMEITGLAGDVWLWLEARRLKHPFASFYEYVFDGDEKCPATAGWRNYLLTLRMFGGSAALDSLARRHPRERLFNALCVLLWQGETVKQPRIIRFLQKQLRTAASDWTGLVDAYKRLWPVCA